MISTSTVPRFLPAWLNLLLGTLFAFLAPLIPSSSAATVYFNTVFLASGSSYTITTQSVTVTTAMSASSFTFTSENPALVSFSGNNVSGYLSYISGGVTTTVAGVISRQNKTGSTSDAFYFVQCNLTSGSINQTSPTGTAYYLIVPGRSNSNTQPNATYGTSSDPMGNALNGLLSSQASSPKISVALSGSSLGEAAGFAVFDVTLSTAAGSTVTFTPALSASGSSPATIGTDTASTLAVSINGGTNWPSASAGVSMSAGVTSVKLRVAIVDDLLVESGETFTVSTGTVTGGGVLNSSGTFATVTIVDNDSANTAPVATPQSGTTPANTALPILLSGTDADGNALTASVVSGPSNGALSGTAPNVTYTPSLNYIGADTFTFKVNDGTVDSSAATVSITVQRITPTITVTPGPYTYSGSGQGPGIVQVNSGRFDRSDHAELRGHGRDDVCGECDAADGRG